MFLQTISVPFDSILPADYRVCRLRSQRRVFFSEQSFYF